MAEDVSFAKNLRKFARCSPEVEEILKPYLGKQLTEDDHSQVQDALARILLDGEYIELVIRHFRSNFVNIATTAFNSSDQKEQSSSRLAHNTVVLSKLAHLHPDSESIILKYFKKNGCPFATHDEFSPPKKRKCLKQIPTVTDVELVHACYTLLKFKPLFFTSEWNWHGFFERFAAHKGAEVKWLYCHCYAIYTGMNEAQLNSYLRSCLTNDEIIAGNLKYLVSKPSFPSKKELQYSTSDTGLTANASTVNIGGIFVPIFNAGLVRKYELLEVKSTLRNLKKVALGIVTNKVICLTGPVGSGKTSLVEYLASCTGRVFGESFIKVQLGDQTDSKMLLGSYRCTDVPGEFIWQPGVLTQAVMDGSWLLLEDIDSASTDIACVISGLIENNYLSVPGYRDQIAVTPGFQLFLTHRLVTTISGHHKRHSNAISLLDKNILNVDVEPLNPSELKQIISQLYPSLTTIADRMVNVFLLFTEDTLQLPRSARLISTRDLFKWCSRAIIDFDVSSQSSALKVLQDAIDIFCSSFSVLDDRINLAKEISTHLGVINEKAIYFCKQYKPNMTLLDTNLNVGRVFMVRTENEAAERVAKFCFTRPSACLLERIMVCVNNDEPVLLVGETGTGKTYTVQYLAGVLGQKLVVINMNQQSDSADLLGGYKPVDLKLILKPVKVQFENVFIEYFKVEPNKKFLQNLNYCFNEGRWSMLVSLMRHSYKAAMKRLSGTDNLDQLGKWTDIGTKLDRLELQLKHKNALAFSFIEGSLVKAVENGYWVLLDEINLANAETLECLSGLLEGSKGSLSLLERGDKKPVVRHPNFTLFACMNPSTDVGKKDLPAGLRNRFTEFFVDELTDKSDLILLVQNYLEASAQPSEKITNIVKFYTEVRKEAVMSLSDGLGHKPHFSLRTLCRALTILASNPCRLFVRSCYEAFCLSFLTQLDSKSYKAVEDMIAKYTVGSQKEVKSMLKQSINKPKSSEPFLQFEGYWIPKGDLEPTAVNDYILTESVRKNLKDLVRVVSIGKLPVLLQGDTSVGKTSLITYLAKSAGYKCVRINNHEHTDLQEYIGSYVANTEGKLQFREGLLVQAMRKGHWIILDELNLAPTDVLEALNRVLDDNRELFIPETQEIVRAHEKFMLFATQNPPGAYGGRKMLSRAFRNRFVELHFNEIPHEELEFILHKRCQMAPSHAKKLVKVMKDLQTRRKGSAAFAGKHGFITLRDLFRWGERYRLAQTGSVMGDWDQLLADEGYLLLAGKVRKEQEREEISEAILKNLGRQVSPENLFTLSEKTSLVTRLILEKIKRFEHLHNNIVWTYNMRQLAVLVSKSLEFKEPVLLVGDTGGGKTTVCSIIAKNNAQNLATVNCHMHTESSDFIGGLRPVRDHSDENVNKIFEWVDGPLVQAMQQGDLFLADEISLADDSVLERLNSLLEPERTLLLAEKGSGQLIVAHENFHFVGTMNPGGDFGKKELSPALRNRFTEIWCESCNIRQDLVDIINHNLKITSMHNVGSKIMNFIEWFKQEDIGSRFTVSIRDVLTWVNFINACVDKIDLEDAYEHGAHLTFLDSLGSGITATESHTNLCAFRVKCRKFLRSQMNRGEDILSGSSIKVERSEKQFGIHPFYVDVAEGSYEKNHFAFNAPTTASNARTVLRALQLNKAILLEGSPGVGKTSLVTALAKATGNKIFRVNLSDQTDISDLFGADLPVEDGEPGQFCWRDGPLLQALRQGHWILLDELNLASQSVLEGLNACLDHRGEIFIPELGKTFYVITGTRFFGCQNPVKQGGARRGLPKSFLNRFTQVYLNCLGDEDLLYILSNEFPKVPKKVLKKMIEFNTKLNFELEKHSFGSKGSPWEFNLRDMTRWCQATIYRGSRNNGVFCPESLVKLLYIDRMRTKEDKVALGQLFESVFGTNITGKKPVCYVTHENVIIGDISIKRNLIDCNESVLKQEKNFLVLRDQLHILRSLAYCVELNWMSILVGPSGSGKTSVVHTLAKLLGKPLQTMSVTSAMDTSDILGGFEQADYTRHLEDLVKKTKKLVLTLLQRLIIREPIKSQNVIKRWEAFLATLNLTIKNATMQEETKNFHGKLLELISLYNYLQNEVLQEEEDKAAVDNLEEVARKILLKLKTENSLNAGGKFEWVDSILIKCLQEGSWLLIDNVNFCNAAVLDRLNALLEPEGVLTIGERGVDKDGNMVEIKPHANFRLFLTMDPKNGEISRAMRNRGVEIFLTSSENVANTYDTIAIIKESGLSHDNIAKKMKKIHDNLCSKCEFDKPTIMELVHASFLIRQQVLRGIPLDIAFRDIINEVYCKSNYGKTCEGRESVNDLITTVLNSEEESAVFVDATLRTASLESCSQLALIQQHALSLRQNCELALQKYFAVHFLTMGSIHDVNHRLQFMKQLFKKENKQTSKQISFILKECGLKATGLPIDHRWLPDTNSSEDNRKCNSVLLMLYYTFNEDFRTEAAPFYSLYQYLVNVDKGRLETQFDDPVLESIINLLDQFNVFYYSLMHTQEHLTNINVVETLSLLHYRYALLNYLRTSPVHDPKIDQDIFNHLHIYYKWFVKFSVNKMQLLLNIRPNDQFSQIISKINSRLTRQFNILCKIGKAYRKCLDKPNIEILKTAVYMLTAAFSFYDIYKDHTKARKTVLGLLSTPDIREKLSQHKEAIMCGATTSPPPLNQAADEEVDLNYLTIFDFFCLQTVLNLRNNQEYVSCKCNLDFVTVPLHLTELITAYSTSLDRSLLYELNFEAVQYIRKSAALHPSIFETDTEAKVTLTPHLPVLTYLIANLVITKEGDNYVTTTKVKNYVDKIKMYKDVQILLWQNMMQVSRVEYDYIQLERKYLLTSFKNFIGTLAKSLQIPQDNFSPSDLLGQIWICIESMYNSSEIYSAKKECESIQYLFSGLKSVLLNLDDNSGTEVSNLNTISNAYMLLGYTRALFKASLPVVDSLQKIAIKKKCYDEEISEFEVMLASFEKCNDVLSGNKETMHVLCEPIKRKLVSLKEAREELNRHPQRDSNVNYGEMQKFIDHGFNTILKPHKFFDLYQPFHKVDVLNQTEHSKLPVEYIRNFVIRIDKFTTDLQGFKYNFPDIVHPLVDDLMELQHGLNIKQSVLKKMEYAFKVDTGLVSAAIEFVKVPSLDENLVAYRNIVTKYVDRGFVKFIGENFTTVDMLRIHKCGLMDIKNMSILDVHHSKVLNKVLFEEFNKVLGGLVELWRQHERQVELRKKEEESLYKTRTKCDDKTEDELAEEEFTELFPDHEKSDFPEFQSEELGDSVSQTETTINDVDLFGKDDMVFIYSKHTEFVLPHARTEWYSPAEGDGSSKCDYLTPFLLKCKLFRRVLDEYVDCLSYRMDAELLGTMNVVLHVAKHFGNIEISDSNKTQSQVKYNFYKHANIEESTKCNPILHDLNHRVSELLNDWPDHPTLLSIKQIIERISNFDVNSPVSRFLVGLEMLLTKCNEWEEVAHSGVSLAENSYSITQQIITWIKLEMTHWSHALDMTQEKLLQSMPKHWFFLYNIMSEFNESIDKMELISCLQKFISQSNIIEFEPRLKLLLVFHCHSTFLPKCKSRDAFMNILWNLHEHYKQFLPNVTSKLKAIKTAIDKRLKDFIKITKWKDVNYWSVKEAVLKSRKAIHKFMREYEHSLKEPVSPLLTNDTSTNEELVGIQDRPQRSSPKKYHYSTDSSLYISKLSLRPLVINPACDVNPTAKFISKLELYFKKSKTFCLDSINMSRYPQLLKDLDYFITTVIHTSRDLQDLQVNSSLPKEKQVSEAKGHLQQKKRALSDLFKTLAKIGLSFRKGIVDFKARNVVDEYVTSPIDLSVGITNLVHNKNDDKLLILWHGAEVYYRKSFMRMEILEELVKTPFKDLGMQNVERCKGFAAHLMLLAHSQKQKLVTAVNQLYCLRYYQNIVSQFSETSIFVPHDHIVKLETFLKNVMYTLTQYKVILSSRPAMSNFNENETKYPILGGIFKTDDVEWEDAKRHIEISMGAVESALVFLQKANVEIPFYSRELLQEGYAEFSSLKPMTDYLNIITFSLDKLRCVFGDIPLAKSLKWLAAEAVNMQSLLQNTNPDNSGLNLTADVKALIEKIMLIFQNLYQKYRPNGEVPQSPESDLHDDHLTKLIIKSIVEDIGVLDLKKVITDLEGLVAKINVANWNTCLAEKQLVANLLPFLEQLVFLQQYFTSQLVSIYRITCKLTSILLNIFIDLTSKGFCVPSDLSDEVGEEGESKTTGGIGLGDGEGEKDVSDKIESEDQLDDTQQAGKEKEKEEDKDCKEEDKGIEMSEDFDSKLQDIEQKPEDDENEEDESNSDAEEQMGETNEGADQLDKELWNSEDEDEPAEEDKTEKKDEQSNRGEKEGEQEMGAKQDDGGASEEQQNEKSKGKEQEKPEINEMEEQELDDRQVDPYHGNQPELPEPEPMDLPEDLQLDDGEENKEPEENNPFDIDAMKDQIEPPSPKEDEPMQTEKVNDEKNDNEESDESDKEIDPSISEVKEDEDEANADDTGENRKEDEGAVEDEQKEMEKSQETGLDETQTQEEQAQAMDVDNATSADNVQSVSKPEKQQSTTTSEDVMQEDNPDNEGVGQSQIEKSKTGHKGQANAEQDSNTKDNKEQMKRNRPGETESDRTLGDASEPAKKKLKTIEASDSTQDDDCEGNKENAAEIYQHIKEAKETHEQVLDAVSKEQAEELKQKEVPDIEDDKATELQMEVPEEDEKDDEEIIEVKELKAEKLEEKKKDAKGKQSVQHPEGEIQEIEDVVEIEGDVVDTYTASRGDTTYHTQLGEITNEGSLSRLSQNDINDIRINVEKQLMSWGEAPSDNEAEKAWEKISSLTATLAQDLSEQLRLVLEPTQASHLKGNFRTGRRINMRKVIPYIASQFRKDKIWLRRTKPSKREYQIVLAIDDSSSMADNHSKELAFESVSLISKALTLLESGQLSVLSFGESTQIVHKLTEPFDESSGRRLLQKFQFDQQKTCIAKMVDFVTEMFGQSRSNVNSVLAKLLLIVGDGRNIFSEGESYVRQSVRRARLSNVFMIFVLIDNPASKDSVLDIRKPIFKEGKFTHIESYMDSFPFPFYIILRDINMLPNVLSDALRQWFEIVINID